MAIIEIQGLAKSYRIYQKKEGLLASVRGLFHREYRQVEAVRAEPRLHVLEVASDGSAAHVRELLSHLEAAGAPALKVSTHRPSLDDVFLSLTGSQAARTASPAEKELAR